MPLSFEVLDLDLEDPVVGASSSSEAVSDSENVSLAPEERRACLRLAELDVVVESHSKSGFEERSDLLSESEAPLALGLL